MKTHTSSFKEQIKLMGKEIDSRITFGDTVLGKDDLNAVTPSYQGAILKSVMKQLDIDSNVEIPIGTILKYEFGLKVNEEYEYINYGNYVVYSIEKQEDTNSYKIVCYDKLLYSMLDYVKLPITYPISVRDYANAISTALGLKFANKSGTFANYDKQIQADLYDGLGYTFRDVLDELAQVTASTICLNNNDELEIRYITETNDTIDEEFLKDVNVNFGEKFGAVNTIVLSRSSDSDSVYYPSILPANPYELKISDNQIMNGNDRADFLPDIYNKLNGLEFYTNDFVSTGIVYYDLCDRYSVKVGDNIYSCVMFNDEVLVTQGLEENIYTELPEQTETDYKHASKDDRMINQVYIIAKKNEAEILAVVNTTKEIQKEIKPTKDESGSEIVIEDASNNPLTYLEVEGKSTQETRSGKNLWNLSPEFANDTSVEEWVLSDTIFSIPAGTYTFSCDMTGETNGIILNYKYADNVDHRTVNNGEATITFTEEVKKIAILLKANTSISNIQLEKGTEATEYEPYGISPSPDYPSEIESVGYENLVYDATYSSGRANYWSLVSVQSTNIVEGQTYTASVYLDSEGDSIVYWNDVSGVLPYKGFRISKGLNRYTYTFTAKKSASNISIILSKSDTNDNYLITPSKLQIEKGTVAHSYNPYGKYGVEVKTVGKNKFDKNSVTNGYRLGGDGTPFAESGYWLSDYIKVKSSVNYVYSRKGFGGSQAYAFYDKDKNFISRSFMTNSTTITISTTDATKYIRITDVNESLNVAQLEESSNATEYQPYQEITSTMVLNEPLRSLSNGVKDIAYIRNNKLYVDRKIGNLQITKDRIVSLTNSLTYSKEARVDKSSIDNIKASDRCVFMSNTFEFRTTGTWGIDEIGIFAHAGTSAEQLAFRIPIDEDVTFFDTNPTYINYELETPVTEEYDEIEMLKTLKGHNNISTTDKLLPIINLTYVRDTVIADYVENHVTELKLTENEIKASVESVSSSVDGLNTTINRVEEITNDNSQVINVISTNIDKTSGEVREVTTTTGFTFNADGMTIDDGSGFKAEHTANGTYYKDGESIVGQYTKDGSKQKDLELFGTYSYGKESIEDTPMFVGQLYTDANGERGFGHFYNGEG